MDEQLIKIVSDARDPSTPDNTFTKLYTEYKQVRDVVVSRKIQGNILKSIDNAVISLSYLVRDLKQITNEGDLEIAATATKKIVDDCYSKLVFLKSMC